MGTKTIVCADDSVTMQTVAEITFRATEFNYVGARSADEALKAARESKPVLVLADAVMSEKTGYDLCEAIKADADLKDVPVMMMCGNSQPYDPSRGAKVGVDGHVTKPWDTQVMLDKVRELLERAGAEGVADAGAGKPAAEAAPAAKADKPAPAAAKPAAEKPAAAPPAKPSAPPAKPSAPPAKPSAPPAKPAAKPAAPPATPAAAKPPARPSAPAAPKPPAGDAAAKPPQAPSIPKPGSAAAPTGSAASPSKPTPAPAERSMPEPAKSPRSTLGGAPAGRAQRPTRPGTLGDDEPTQARPGNAQPGRGTAPRASTVPPSTAPAQARSQSQAGKGMPRPPMIRGTPARRPTVPPQSRQSAEGAKAGNMAGRSPTLMGMPMLQMPPGQRKPPEGVTPVPTGGGESAADGGAARAAAESASAAVSERASEVAREAGIDPNGPEMAALVKLSREVVERVVWEVVPDLAETIIRENLDRLASK